MLEGTDALVGKRKKKARSGKNVSCAVCNFCGADNAPFFL